MANVYDQLGVRRVINAAGTLTRLSGSLMHSHVVQAMVQASEDMVRIDHLQAAVGRRVAALTHAESALVTCGAAAGLTLAAAACLADLDPVRMDRLPDTGGMPNEVVIARSHRNGYDHSIRAAGARLVEVGLAERTRDPQPWELQAAVSSQTIAMMYCDGFSSLRLEEVIEVAHRNRLTVIVDASASLPPRSNLSKFCDMGADLVVFSGGKAIGGPQASGILCGRKRLVASAALQMLDMDDLPELWCPPESLVERAWLCGGIPNHGIGRGMKVGKEEIVGLWTALERFATADEAAQVARYNEIALRVANALADLPDVIVRCRSMAHGWQCVDLQLGVGTCSLTAIELARFLEQQDPAIHLATGAARQQRLTIDPHCLQPGDAETIITAIRNALLG